MTVREAEEFFQSGGALEADAPSYVTRQADHELSQAIQSGHYCNVLTARQIGKSSLMVRSVSRLQAQGIRTVVIDLTRMGTTVSAAEWYFGLLSQFRRQLGLSLDDTVWWTERHQLSPVQRFSDFLRQVVLTELQESIVVFIDEIDSTLSLPFTDDFFAAVRAAYNARASDPAYNRLTFVLLGVARPADLIKARSRTPYNIGASIDLTDFTAAEAQTLLDGLKLNYPDQAEMILKRVLHWTDGHPYLTQKICAAVVAEDGPWTGEWIDELAARLFLTEEARRETNLRFIRDRIQASEERGGMLRIYRQVWSGKPVKDEERSAAKSRLKLTGLVKVRPNGNLTVRNRIYARVFDMDWIKETMPISWAWRAAVAAITAALLTLVVLGYLIYRDRTLPDSIRAEQFTNGFQSATNPDVRLNNLANLFRLNGYATQAGDLFFGLNTAQRLALFVGLSDPQQVGADVLTVVEGVYQDQRLENNPEHNQLLQTMAEVLHEVEGGTVAGAEVRAREIDYWLAGRNAAAEGDFTAAVEQYDLALGLNEDNAAVLFDRGIAYVELKDYENALADLQTVWDLDQEREAKIRQVLQGDTVLFASLDLYRPNYPIVATLFGVNTPAAVVMSNSPTPTDTPVPTLTPTATPVPTSTPTHTPSATHTPTHTPTPTPTFTPTPTPTKTPVPLAGIIDDFESSSGVSYRVIQEQQANSAFGQSTEHVNDGDSAGKLSYDFPTRQNDFVVFEVSSPILEPVLEGQPNLVTAQVYGDGLGHFLNVWIRDSAGERWQFPFGQIDHTDWQTMTAYLDPSQGWPAEHIDGPTNNVVDYPIRFVGLTLDDAVDSYAGTGEIYIDNLTSGNGTRPLPPIAIPIPTSVVIDFRADATTLNAGECTMLRWNVRDVVAFYLDNAPMTGPGGSREECPLNTTTYTLHIVLNDNSEITRTVTITVTP
jgi:tetratricopeptide (TPR) repeat protein